MTEGQFKPRWTYRSTPRFKIVITKRSTRFASFRWMILGAGFLPWCVGMDPSESFDGYWYQLHHPDDSSPASGKAWSYESAMREALSSLVPFQTMLLCTDVDLSESRHEIVLQ